MVEALVRLAESEWLLARGHGPVRAARRASLAANLSSVLAGAALHWLAWL